MVSSRSRCLRPCNHASVVDRHGVNFR